MSRLSVVEHLREIAHVEALAADRAGLKILLLVDGIAARAVADEEKIGLHAVPMIGAGRGSRSPPPKIPQRWTPQSMSPP